MFAGSALCVFNKVLVLACASWLFREIFTACFELKGILYWVLDSKPKPKKSKTKKMRVLVKVKWKMS